MEKYPSGATSEPEVAPKTEGASPGGTFPQAISPSDSAANSLAPSKQFTLQYLIAALKKTSHKE